jgi:hypothetical protein
LRSKLFEKERASGSKQTGKEAHNMKAPVRFERAKKILQGWYDEYRKERGKSCVCLDIQEDDVSGAYKLKNPETGAGTSIFWSTVSDYEQSGSMAIPGELKGSIWDSLQDLG